MSAEGFLVCTAEWQLFTLTPLFGLQKVDTGPNLTEINQVTGRNSRSGTGGCPAPTSRAVRATPVGVQDPGFRVQGSGFRVQGSGFRVQGSGFRVQGSGFRVQGPGLKVWGYRVQLLGWAAVVQRAACTTALSVEC